MHIGWPSYLLLLPLLYIGWHFFWLQQPMMLVKLVAALGGESARRGAGRLLDTWAAVLPTRIANEDLGDYLEDINLRFAKGQHLVPWIRVVAALFWTGINAIGFVLRNVTGREKTGV